MSTALDNNVEQLPEQPGQKVIAVVVPLTLYGQMIELIRGNAVHRDADPILQQCAQLKAQEIMVRQK